MTGKFQLISRHLYNFQTKKRPDIVAWSNSKKSVLLIELTPLGRKPGGGTQAEEKPIRDAVCWLRGKRLDIPCDFYWGWLSWFSFCFFQNWKYWLQFESCLKSSSNHSAICIKLDLVESEKSSAWMKCTRNHHSRVIT